MQDNLGFFFIWYLFGKTSVYIKIIIIPKHHNDNNINSLHISLLYTLTKYKVSRMVFIYSRVTVTKVLRGVFLQIWMIINCLVFSTTTYEI